MKVLRSLLSCAFFLAYGLLALAFAPLLALPFFGGAPLRRLIRFFYRALVRCARATALFRVEIDDAARAALANARGCVIAMNHVSLIDIVVLLAHLPDSTAIAKPDVMRNPALRTVAKKMFIVNDGDTASLMESAMRFLADGVNVVVFPQGTRGGKTLHRGAARLAIAAQRPLLPVRIDYTPVVLAKSQPWWYAGERTVRIRLATRPPLNPPPAGGGARAAARAMTGKIARAIMQA